MEETRAPRYWLMSGSVPAGPFDVRQLHEKLAAGEIDWRTRVCLVGGDAWIPLIEAPGLGPGSPDDASRSSIRPEPKRSSPPSPAEERRADGFGGGYRPGEIDDSRSISRGSETLLRVLNGLILADVATNLIGLGLAVLYMIATSHQDVPDKPLSTSDGIACIGFLLYVPASIIAWIGMWFTRNWSRWLYVGTVALGHFFGLGAALFDTSASWHFPDAVSSLGSSVGGILIGLAFFSPLTLVFRDSGRKFVRSSNW
jgi:hypothetical protein